MNGSSRPVRVSVIAFLAGFSLLFASAAFAQSCPTQDAAGQHDAAEASVLHGTLVHHDELRTWLGLKLDQPACGETEIQLTFATSDALRDAETLRNCGVTATGALFLAPTPHYSAAMAIEDPRLQPDPSCRPLPLEPDPSKAPVAPDLRTYHVLIAIDTRGKGHTDVRVSSDPDAGAPLAPWQAYAHFSLNGGGDVLWFGCREGFAPAAPVKNRPSTPDYPRLLNSDLGIGLDVDAVNTVQFVCRRVSDRK
jgi:hypothetical protein